MSRFRSRRKIAGSVAFVVIVCLFVISQLGYIFNLKMTTAETERWLREHHGYVEIHCRHSYSLGVLDWDYYCRVYDEGGYVWSPRFEVNGHEQTRQTNP